MDAVSIVSISLVCDSRIMTTCPSIQLPALLYVCVLFVLFMLIVFVLSVEPPPTPPPPGNLIAGSPKAALLICLLTVVYFNFLAWLVSLLLCLLCLFPLSVILELWSPVLQSSYPLCPYVCVLFILFLLFVFVLSGEPKQKQG